MQSADVLSRLARPPDVVLSYGRPDQIADLWLPPAGTAPGPVPLIVFLHGGFWRAAYDRTHAGPLAEALAAAGFAVCVPEYRRVGQHGGGWPGTFEDVRAAVERVPGLTADAAAGRVAAPSPVLAGHSAGGHLALWAAGQLPDDRVSAVVSLAGVCDLAACYRDGLGQRAADGLMGGGPDQVPDRYEEADPMAAVPLAARVVLVHGTADDRVPWQQSDRYAAAATAAGGDARCVLLPGTGHFEVIDPLSAAWPAVLAEFQRAAG
jgi:dipeptidyl aminopeptidase/acylaminoacyl peptidase